MTAHRGVPTGGRSAGGSGGTHPIRCVALLDFDGVLCDMEPFAYELNEHRGVGNRWSRFYCHTSQAAPVDAGVELVAALDRLGWRYAVSAIRPAGYRPMVGPWLRQHLTKSRPAEWWYVDEIPGWSAVNNKRAHWVQAMVSRDAPVCPLFVDDEPAVVEKLIDRGVPAMCLDELAGLSDADLAGVLQYSLKGAIEQQNALRVQARHKGILPTARDKTSPPRR